MQRTAVSAPIQSSLITTSGAPRMSGTAQSIRVKFRELLDTSILTAEQVTAANGGFVLAKTYALQPGLQRSFPWLSAIAQRYDQYKVHSLIYEYVNTSSAVRDGMIMMSPDYDAYDPAPENAREALSRLGARSGPVWQAFSLDLAVGAANALGKRRFTRKVRSARDLVVTDVGNMHICVDGLTTTTALSGQIWVNYDFEFFAPQYEPDTASAKDTATYEPINMKADNAATFKLPDSTIPVLDKLTQLSSLNVAPDSLATLQVKTGLPIEAVKKIVAGVNVITNVLKLNQDLVGKLKYNYNMVFHNPAPSGENFLSSSLAYSNDGGQSWFEAPTPAWASQIGGRTPLVRPGLVAVEDVAGEVAFDTTKWEPLEKGHSEYLAAPLFYKDGPDTVDLFAAAAGISGRGVNWTISAA